MRAFGGGGVRAGTVHHRRGVSQVSACVCVHVRELTECACLCGGEGSELALFIIDGECPR